MTQELTPETVGRYLTERGVVAAGATVEATTLGGGVSNVVLAVETDGKRLVVKQPLANLAVEDDWPADVERVHNEAAAARVYRDVLEADPGVRIPEVVFEDRDQHVVVIESAPPSATMWKAELLDGRVEPGIAETVGRALGRLQHAVAGNDGVRERFANERPFRQLRIDPYHRTVARRHPGLASPIREEIERVLGEKRTLVHGDYSPKNVLVDRTGDRRALWLLDFEVAHWGDPSFDAAFMLNHLFIKSVYNADRQEEYLAATERFWEAYDRAVDWDVERAVVRELGVLLLARVDGKSPVEYVTEASTKDRLRSIAIEAIERPPESLDGFRGIVEGSDD